MKRCALYVFFLLSYIASTGQDILMSRDSSKIEAKIIEINATQITYKRFNYQWGPSLVADKDEFAYVIHQNGQVEHFVVFPTPASGIEEVIVNRVNVSSKNDSLQKAAKIGDYIKFNIYAGLVVNNAYCNLEWYRTNPKYTGYNSAGYNCNINVGFNFLFGKNKYIKPLFGINYLRSKGEFDYIYTSGGAGDRHSYNLSYVSKIDFINFSTGFRVEIGKHLSIEPLVSFNLIAKSDVRYSGTHTHAYDHMVGYPGYYVSTGETEVYNNVKAGLDYQNMENTFSFCPRISYEFNIKQQRVGVYFSYNLAYLYRLPWYMVGVSYYPFKKLK